MSHHDEETQRHGWHLRLVLPWVALAAAVAVVAGLVFLVVHYATSINVEVLTVDPVAEVGLPPYVGVFSHIGVLMLWAGASACLFAWSLLRRSRLDKDVPRMILALGLLIGWLALDDLFLIHEEIGRVLAELLERPEDRSLLEAPVFMVYGAFWLVWALRYRATIARTPFLLLSLGVAVLGVSMGIDLGEFIIPDIADATPWMATTMNMAEELAKLIGILLMLGYAVASTSMMLQRMAAAEGAVESAMRQNGGHA